MVRNAWVVLLVLAAVAACSRSSEPVPPLVEVCSAPENASADAPANRPFAEPVKDTPANPSPKADFQAEKRSKVLPRGYSRELKVLYIEQGFRHEARFLNENLKRDKGLAYQGFFMDASDGWTQPSSKWSDEVKKRVRPLTYPFYGDGKIIRKQDEFLAQKYDVVIVGDVNPADYFWRREYWKWLETWVEAGGGVIFLTGSAHHPQNYLNYESYLELCPVYLEVPEGREVDVNLSAIKYYGRTEEGRVHEILRLENDDERNDQLFGAEQEGQYQPGELNGLYSYRVTHKARAGAKVLARVAREGEPIGEAQPLIVTRQFGEGRVLWLGTDDFHYWRQWVGEHYFYRFWQNCIRWAANDPGK